MKYWKLKKKVFINSSLKLKYVRFRFEETISIDHHKIKNFSSKNLIRYHIRVSYTDKEKKSQGSRLL